MPGLRKPFAIPVGLALASFAIALLQRPGQPSSDTKIDLYTDPVGFLGDVASAWTDAFGLGAVWSGQYSGYLWPMGPFFAGGDLLGLPDWVVHRLWLGLALALAAWGTVRLVDTLHSRERGIAHLVAGAVVVFNPYVVVFANRTSITLLAYASLPWLLLAAHRGLRDPRGWWWPAAFALILASAGGGVNAATTAWLLAAPVLLGIYEIAVIGVAWRSALAFAARAAPLVLLTSAWWLVPTLVQVAYGIDFLIFTEQPSVIWNTTSLTESLRGMGYWTAYTELGFGGRRVPFFSDAGTLLFNPAVIVASLLVPALAFGGFALARRRPYAPFLLGMVLLGAFVMMAGFPESSPLRRAITALYEGFPSIQFLRTTYKAGPLVLVGLAVLVGLGAEALWLRYRRPLPRAVLGAVMTTVLVFASLPFFMGRAVDDDVRFDVPAAYESAAADVDERMEPNTRALVLPGSLFGFHEWGATTDPALPVLTDRPTAARFEVPYSDLRAIDLLWTTDGLVQERRTLPGQLPPLLDRLGVGSVLSPTDYDARRAGSVAPADAARAIEEGGLTGDTRDFGPRTPLPAAPSTLDTPIDLPRLRRYTVSPTGGGLVRVRPRGPATVVDGSAQGVAALTAFGDFDSESPLLYAADQEPAQLRRLADAGATFVISDSNRRRVFVNSRIRANTGRTLDAGAAIPPDAAVLDPFDRGPDAQTVTDHVGASYVRGTVDASLSQFSERRPEAAVDGDPDTQWIANAFLRQGTRPFVEVGFERRRDVATIELLPYGDARGRPVKVDIGGTSHEIRPGWNRLRVGLRDVESLRVTLDESVAPDRGGGPGGIRELRIPGLRVRDRLRMPRLTARALRGRSLERSPLHVIAERTTPFSPRRLSPPSGPLQAGDLRNRADPEPAIERTFELPRPRRFAAQAWTSAGLSTPAPILDRLAGYTGALRADSSPIFESVPGRRASSAFDGDDATAWYGAFAPGSDTWLAWRTPERRTLSRLRLRSPEGPAVRLPTRVRLRWPGGASDPLSVGADGAFTLPRPVSARSWRLEVLTAALPAAAPPTAARRRAVAIAELSGPGVPSATVPRGGPLQGRCGDAGVRLGDVQLPLRPTGTVADLDGGRALSAAGCAGVDLPAGSNELRGSAGPLRTDTIKLTSAAPQPADPEAGGGRILDPGELGRGSVRGVRLDVDGPSWLVLGEAYSRGWRATCDGRDLGEPEPIDGYANGWRVDRCERAEFDFAPNGPVRISYLVSLIAALLLAALLILRRPAAAALALTPAQADRAPRWRLPIAVGAAGVAAGLLGLAFALRAGAVAGPLVGLVLWRGIGARSLAATAAGLLGLVVPAIYLLATPTDLGGFNSSYPIDLLAAHWVGVGVVILGALATWHAAQAVRATRLAADEPEAGPGTTKAP